MKYWDYNLIFVIATIWVSFMYHLIRYLGIIIIFVSSLNLVSSLCFFTTCNPAYSFWSAIFCEHISVSYSFSHFSAYYSDICVGAIACRLEKRDDGTVRVYIMTLGVLAPYRGLGVGMFSISLFIESVERFLNLFKLSIWHGFISSPFIIVGCFTWSAFITSNCNMLYATEYVAIDFEWRDLFFFYLPYHENIFICDWFDNHFEL